MATVVLFMLQPRPISISLDAVILALGGLPALRLPVSARNSQTSSTLPSPPEPLPGLDEMLSALPFPTALVSPDDQPLSINAEATHRLEDGCPSRLTSPLRALARRVADGRESEAVHMTLVEGQPLLRLHASPLLKRAQRAGGGHTYTQCTAAGPAGPRRHQPGSHPAGGARIASPFGVY
jgi:hypothetical protein